MENLKKRVKPIAAFAMLLTVGIEILSRICIFFGNLISGGGFSFAFYSAFFHSATAFLLYGAILALGILLLLKQKDLINSIVLGGVFLFSFAHLIATLVGTIRWFYPGALLSLFGAMLENLGWLLLTALSVFLLIRFKPVLKLWFLPAIPFALTLVIVFFAGTVDSFQTVGKMFSTLFDGYFSFSFFMSSCTSLFLNLLDLIKALALTAGVLALGKWFLDRSCLDAPAKAENE